VTTIDLKWRKFVESGKTKAVIRALIKKRRGDGAERPNGYDPAVCNSYYRQNSLIGSSIDDLVDSICGAGVKVKVVSIDDDKEIPYSDIPEFAAAMRMSRPNWTIYRAIHDALRIHDGFIVKKYSGSRVTSFAPVPPNEMRVDRTPTMEVTGYYQEIGSETDWIRFKPAEIVQIKSKEITGDPYGVSLIERISENADILRDIGLDFAKFLATKSYPPTVWKFGTPERPWSDLDIRTFMDSLEDIDPGAQIGVRGDIDPITLNPDVQMPDVKHPLTYYTATIVNGLGVPAVSTGLLSDATGSVGELQEKAYNRRVNAMRTLIGEQLEIELFDQILESNGYEDMQSVLIWNQHDDEQHRMLVNDIVQLGQNGFVTKEYGQGLLGFPAGSNMAGEYLKVTDRPEGASPALQAEADQNKTVDVKAKGKTDSRKGSKRREV
jgi:hypothetical protein